MVRAIRTDDEAGQPMNLAGEPTGVDNPFKTLLHNLMNGRFRVNHLDLYQFGVTDDA